MSARECVLAQITGNDIRFTENQISHLPISCKSQFILGTVSNQIQ